MVTERLRGFESVSYSLESESDALAKIRDYIFIPYRLDLDRWICSSENRIVRSPFNLVLMGTQQKKTNMSHTYKQMIFSKTTLNLKLN